MSIDPAEAGVHVTVKDEYVGLHAIGSAQLFLMRTLWFETKVIEDLFAASTKAPVIRIRSFKTASEVTAEPLLTTNVIPNPGI
jgi:hypothetical protein